MDFSKVVRVGAAFVLCCSALCLGSCGNKTDSDIVEVDRAVADSLSKRVEVFADATQEQREMLFRILKELDGVSDAAFALGKERYLNGQVKDIRMVDHIKYKLATIKTELDQAQKDMLNNPSLMETIEDLQNKIKEQEEYIQHLRSSITVKKSDLKTRYEQLEEIKEDLDRKIQENLDVSEDLENQNNQINEVIKFSWESAGDKLVSSADEVDLVKSSGPLVKKTREAKKRILNRAIQNYKEAERLGNTSVHQKIRQAESKMQNL